MKVLVIVSMCVVFCLVADGKRRNEEEAANAKRNTRDRWGLNPALQRTSLPVRSGINPTGRRVDRNFAEFSWKSFQLSNNLNERKERKKKKAMRQLRAGAFSPRGSIGPPGPRGPMGPTGPKGANITKEEMFEEFRLMINELTQRKLLVGADPRCTELCVSTLAGNSTGPVAQASLFDQDVLVPKIASSFMWQLREYTKVPKHSKMALDEFKQSNKPGAYGREPGDSKANTGRFVAPRTGFYHFSVRLHLHMPHMDSGSPPPPDQLFSVALTVDGVGGSDLMLETLSGFGPGEKMTVTVNGMVYLKVNEYVCVVIDNPSKYDFDIYDGSQFSGYLMGV
ncbi:hypothetical protein JTE90_026812 [Oedothorax gibbosus]|uniref:C1q domain-containing protein n=1 Tax=Oedothorax gibbosus TaxID=931172 RepID=A0AAV6V6I0_9ARAC|nr:hypothetical protein JTE90_026812 [Oedothorax gibbosus]